MKEVRPVLLLGAKGMLGRAFSEAFSAAGRPFIGWDVDEVDITDPDSVGQLPFARYPLVINCAAYTNVDGAEENEELATRVNGHAVGHLAEACAQHECTLVHFSTDYVFDGQATEPYRVDAPRAPLNAYGRGKALAEERILASGADHLILRTSWLYAPWGQNFVLTMLRLTHERDVLRVVSDQRGRPSSAQGVVHTVFRLLAEGARGILHATDAGECTWYELTQAIVEFGGGKARIEPCTSEEFPRPAKRPAYSVLDLAPTEALIGPLVPWRDRLARTIEAVQR